MFRGYSIRLVRGQYLKERGTNKRTSTWRPGEPRKATKERKPSTDTKMRVRVQIDRETFLDLKADFLSLAKKRSWSSDVISAKFYNLPFEPYAPARKQLLQILRQVNKARGLAGMPNISPNVIRFKRKIVKPFDDIERATTRAA